MAAMFERLRSSGSSRSDGSTSADSGIGSTRRSTLDKCTCDVINSRFMDDVLKHSSQNGASASDTFQTSEDDSDIRHKNGELHEKDSVISSESHVPDYAHAQDDDTSLPEHLDSFDDVAQAMVEQIRNRKKKSASVEDSVEDDVFDDRWHSGHDDSETCPYCKEFERATKGRVDRYFGGAESFLDWIFSKWGKGRIPLFLS
nr:hypothetical protein BaRGS_023686 [Batillaria attramentaria]